MSLFPIFLKLEGRRCLVVGAGSVALEKIQALLWSEAMVYVVAPEAHPEIQRMHSEGRLEWIARAFLPDDLDGAVLVIAATSSRDCNREIFTEASRRAILVNTVDDPPLCDFFSGSVVRRGDLQIAISTAGKSPALAQRLRKEIDGQLAPDLGGWLDELGDLRREILAGAPAGELRKMLLHSLIDRALCSEPECPGRRDALAVAQSLAEQSGVSQ